MLVLAFWGTRLSKWPPLATYRLTVLIKDDKITESLRDFVFDLYGHPEDSDVRNPSYLMGARGA